MEDAGRLPDPVLCVSTPKSSVHVPVVSSPKHNPFSFTVGDGQYVMDMDSFFPSAPAATPTVTRSFVGGRQQYSFQVLSQEWQWHPLPLPQPQPPCYMYDGCRYIDSHAAAVAGTDILVSDQAGDTYRFDTVESTWAVAWDRPLPFSGLAEYVPEHRLWFGLSTRSNGRRFMAVADLMPWPLDSSVVRDCWKEYVQPPPEWDLWKSYAVYLGCSKFCIARFFNIGRFHAYPDVYKTEDDLQMVVTGVE
ncbi:hypothetical protein BS78_07G024700, partial [Paspalum vaginatum]